MLFKLCSLVSDLFLQLLLLIVRAISLHTGDLTLHLLDLEILLIEKLLLPLFLNAELVNVGLQVTRGRESTRDVTNKVSLLSSELEEFLRLFEERFLLRSDFLLNFCLHAL